MGYPIGEVKRMSWTYLHGKLEKKACEHDGYDIFGFKGDMPDVEGIYKGFVEYPDEKIACTIFAWPDSSFKEKLQGLVVADDDEKSFADAENKYNLKESHI